MSCQKATEKVQGHSGSTFRYQQAACGLIVISKIAAVLIALVCLFGSASQAGVSQDANGWTVFTPSPVTSGTCAGGGANGTCVIYVNTTADGGNDATCTPANVGDSSHPCATITKGISLLRMGYPDWLLLKKGDSWVGGYFFNLSGKSSTEPMVVSAYDPANPGVANPYTGGARPLLIVPTNGGNYTSGFQIQANIGGDNLAFVGLNFYASDRDPNNTTITPVFNTANTTYTIVGFDDLNQFSWLLIEDCKFSFFGGDNLSFGSNAGQSGTLIFRRNLVLDSYVAGGLSSGIIVTAVTNPVFQENLFDHNGWNETVPNAGPTVFNHNLYISGYATAAEFGGTSNPATLSIITFQGNIVARDACCGQFRSGGTLDNNLWLLNPSPHNIGAPTAAGPNLVTNNVYLEGVTNSAVSGGAGPTTIGTNIYEGDNYAVGTVTFSGNIVANAHASSGGIAVGGGFLGTIVQNNIVFNWGPAGQEVQNYSGGSIVDSGNTKDAFGSNSSGLNEPFPNPYQLNAVGNSSNIGTNGADGYYASIGNPGGFPSTSVGFLSAARQQSKANWNPALMAAAVNNYVRAGFGLTSTTTPIPTPSPNTTMPPSAPTGLTDSVASASQVNTSWNQSSPGTLAVAGYHVFRNGNKVGDSTTTSYNDSGLSAGTSYTYTVSAFDTAGNVSAQSTPVTATTPISAPHAPPTIAISSPTNGATIKGNGSINIASSASDVTGVKSITITGDNQVLLTCSGTTSCSVTWQGKNVSKGTHVITATATDQFGLQASTSVTVLAQK